MLHCTVLYLAYHLQASQSACSKRTIHLCGIMLTMNMQQHTLSIYYCRRLRKAWPMINVTAIFIILLISSSSANRQSAFPLPSNNLPMPTIDDEINWCVTKLTNQHLWFPKFIQIQCDGKRCNLLIFIVKNLQKHIIRVLELWTKQKSWFTSWRPSCFRL